MSGFAGILPLDGWPVDQDVLRDMAAFLAFRGPDHQETWCDDVIGLGHALHRFDRGPASRPQPLSLDGTAWIVADARIDARRELVDKLDVEDRNRIRKADDAELILHAYRLWSDACLQHLVGDFTFAIWDTSRRRLFCAVDRLRVKPFYFAQVNDTLIFSNTLDCVRLHPGVSERLDEIAVADALLFGCYQDAERTIFSDVRRLPPGHYLVHENGVSRQARYWSWPVPDAVVTEQVHDGDERLQELLDHAVADRLRSQQTGILLSGGLDSPLVAAAAKRSLHDAGDAAELRGYTVVYDRLIPDQERHYAALVSRTLEIPTEFHAADDWTPHDWVATLERPPPEPLLNPSWGWTVHFLKYTASQCSTLLTGDDGDAALMASLPRHWLALLKTGHWLRLAGDLAWYVYRQHRPPPIGLRTWLRRHEASPAMPDWLNLDFCRLLELPERWRACQKSYTGKTPRDLAWAHLQSPIWATLFDSYDAGWIGAPLHVAFPLLDIRLLEFLFCLPAVPWCVNKEIFRRNLRRVLPPAVHERRKTVLPGDPALVKLRAQRGSVELEPAAECFLNKTALTAALHTANSGDHCRAALRAVTLNLWLKAQKHNRVSRHARSRQQNIVYPASPCQKTVQEMSS